MRVEYRDLKGWEGWSKAQEPAAQEKELLKALKDLRIRAEKIGPITPGGFIAIRVAPERRRNRIRTCHACNHHHPVDPTGGKGLCGNGLPDLITHSRISRSRGLEVCPEYLESVEWLVSSCERELRRRIGTAGASVASRIGGGGIGAKVVDTKNPS